ncbi:MAG: hypothetical protein ACK4V6_07600, partial [Microthrixaceae bacterium]
QLHRIAIINDDALVSIAIALLIEEDPRVEVSWLFRNDTEGIGAWTSSGGAQQPDAIVFDTEIASGHIDTTRNLRAACPDAVLALYTSTASDLAALRAAGVDLVFVQADDPRRFRDDLITHL